MDKKSVLALGLTSTLSAVATLSAVLCEPAVQADVPKSQNELIVDIVKDGMIEINLGILAEKKASNREVQAFAQHMVHDHAKANDKLKIAAAQDKIAVPADLSMKQKNQSRSLASLGGADFDRKYMEEVVAGHKRAVDALKRETQIGTGSSKAWAEKTLPVIEEHKLEAENLNARLSQGSVL